MSQFFSSTPAMARHTAVRRAMSLLELGAVLAVVALVATTAVVHFGSQTLGNSGAQSCIRKLSLALVHARRATIATGDNHYLQLVFDGLNVSSYALFRRTGSGDVQVDQSRIIPADVTVTCGSSQLEFDFDGQALGAYTIVASGDDRVWNLSVEMLTGAVQVVEVTP